ncbi:FkbM family methyltransferase [Halomonas sp. 15WGF]|uniref:FkbM family methyltransferase n=1 Tax=Halomonas sp. 15WGF TaxID=2570357 RepID=UPI001485B920|nr:FkbM family methyltransferase [Halomonas sp. 15WGF]
MSRQYTKKSWLKWLKSLTPFSPRQRATEMPTRPAEQEATHSVLGHQDQLQFSQAKTYWLFGEWQRLTELSQQEIETHPERARLALLVASAYQQQDEHDKARTWSKQALAWGCPPRAVAQVLVAGVHNTLGRVATLCEDSERVSQHFHAAINAAETDDADLMAHARSVREMAKLGLLPQASEQVKTLLNRQEQHPIINQQATTHILKTELELLTHELSLAHQRQQLYRDQQKATHSEPSFETDPEGYREQLRKASVSQLGQDLWVLEKTNYKRGGFFVEFGATDGVLLSNTYLLEKEFGWKGICAEPNPKFFEQLKKNRSCITSNACIGGRTGEEVEFILADEFGGMAKHADEDRHKEKRENFKKAGQTIELKTISLHDFLIEHGAPHKIDYISIDTEGSELEIIENFPFNKWKITYITIEHNFTSIRTDIEELMKKNGYTKYEASWDDWYMLKHNFSC